MRSVCQTGASFRVVTLNWTCFHPVTGSSLGRAWVLMATTINCDDCKWYCALCFSLAAVSQLCRHHQWFQCYPMSKTNNKFPTVSSNHFVALDLTRRPPGSSRGQHWEVVRSVCVVTISSYQVAPAAVAITHIAVKMCVTWAFEATVMLIPNIDYFPFPKRALIAKQTQGLL